MTKKLSYKLIRTKRKTLSLQINRKGEIIMRAPIRYPITRIENFFKDKQAWIEKHLKAIPQEKTYKQGEQFLFLGEPYKLQYRSDQELPVLLLDEEISLSSTENPREILIQFYKKEALELFKEQVQLLSERTRLKPSRVLLSRAKHQWGSCAPDDTIRLNWRLIMAPLNVINYVIIHELAHLQHRSHGKRFWNLVEDHYPNHKTQKKWLREHGHLLSI